MGNRESTIRFPMRRLPFIQSYVRLLIPEKVLVQQPTEKSRIFFAYSWIVPPIPMSSLARAAISGESARIETVFPLAQVQLCIVHLVRASLNYVNWRERKPVAADLKPIYRAATAVEAEMNLDSFMVRWISTRRSASYGRELGARDSVLRVSGGSAQGDLHDQCGGGLSLIHI